MDGRFGRSEYLCFLDLETLEGTCEENTLRDGQGGVGIQLAQNLVRRGVKAVITGRVGPNAADVLDAAGIPVYSAEGQTVKQAGEGLRQGLLTQIGI